MVELIDIFLLRKKMDQVVAEKPGLGKALIAWILVFIIYSILAFFWGFIGSVIMALLSAGDVGTIIITYLITGLISLLFTPVVIILALIVSLISDVVVFIFAKLLGGKGSGFV